MPAKSTEQKPSKTASSTTLTRALAHKEFNGIIELDAPLIQARERERLRATRIPIPDNVVFASTNFDAEPLSLVLEKAGYNSHKNCLFLMEGVTYYIEPESVDATLQFVCSNSHAESTIVFDYILSIPEEKMNDYYGARELAENHLKKYPDEKGKFFIEEGAIASFSAQRKLEAADHLDIREMRKRFLANKDGLSNSRVTGWFRIVKVKKQG